MSFIKSQVRETLKWKKSPEYVSEKLGISLKEYKRLKKEVLKERKQDRNKTKFFNKAADNAQLVESIDLEKGTGKLSGTFDFEPKSAEEIVKLLKIDTNQWKLSQYWNKQMGDHWRVSALVTKVKDPQDQLFEELLKNWRPKKFYVPKADIPKLKKDKEKVCGIISLQDIHFGKEGNETIDKDFEDTIEAFISRGTATHYREIIFYSRRRSY